MCVDADLTKVCVEAFKTSITEANYRIALAAGTLCFMLNCEKIVIDCNVCHL